MNSGTFAWLAGQVDQPQKFIFPPSGDWRWSKQDEAPVFQVATAAAGPFVNLVLCMAVFPKYYAPGVFVEYPQPTAVANCPPQ